MTENEHALLTHRDSRMQANNISRPKDAFESFFNCFTLEDCRNHLWELYERCVMSYAQEHTEHDTASDILFFYTHTEMLIEAAWLINNKQERKRRKTKNNGSHQNDSL